MESKIIIRKARKEERHSIRRLVWNACLNPNGLKWQRFLVGVDPSERVIACIQIKHHWDGSKELASLVVSPEYRGRGIARMLVEHLIQNHDGDLNLMCRASLGGFYRRFGFEIAPNEELSPYFLMIYKMASIIMPSRDQEKGLLIMKRWRRKPS